MSGEGVADPWATACTDNPWGALRALTQARIALGRAGTSLPTVPHLAFQADHARARDAVHRPLDVGAVQSALRRNGLDTLVLHSAAADRAIYLQRPDLGRQLDAASVQRLRERAQSRPGGCDLAIVVADGLSSLAIERNLEPLLALLLPALHADGWQPGPVSIVLQGRVAVGDKVALGLGARCVVLLVGERPGLSSPDSLGIYLTWDPQLHTTDAQRNCISNIRPEGLGYDTACHKLMYLLEEARRRQLSGVTLKDETEPPANALAHRPGNFLLGPAA